MGGQQQSSGGTSLLKAGASLLGKKAWLYLLPILFLVLFLPMCGMSVVDSNNPPYTPEQIEIFQKVGQQQNVFFVDLMVYHSVTDPGSVSEGLIRQIAKRFKYTVEHEVPELDQGGEPKKDKDGKIIYRKKKEEKTYSLQEALQRTSLSSDEIQQALVLGEIWALKFGQSPIIGALPPGYVIPNSTFIWPVPGLKDVTSTFGPRWGKMHWGVDLSGPNAMGSPVVAVANGEVTQVNFNTSAACGIFLRVRHKDGFESRYCHLSGVTVKVGDNVNKGQVIGAVGNTGESTGPHLHIEMYKNGGIFDPLPYIYGSR